MDKAFDYDEPLAAHGYTEQELVDGEFRSVEVEEEDSFDDFDDFGDEE